MTKPKVFIGVGHGGKDPGAVSGGLYESLINLTVALACKDELERCGVKVGISRTINEDDKLLEEISEANAFKPDLAVEIHTNSGGGSGFEVYRQTSIAYGDQSLRLARALETRVKAMEIHSRGVKTKLMSNGKDWFGWLREVKAPAVLCEGFFIDNPADQAVFDDVADQQQLGIQYARGIMDYLGWPALKPKDRLYRVQTGAFSSRSNAEAYAESLRAAGFPAIIKEEAKNK